MKIAIIADIHGNLPALQAVTALEHDADMWVCAGDMVGYYLNPDEVCSLVRSLGAFVVRGNHDEYVCRTAIPEKEISCEYRSEYCREVMTHENLQWLRMIPVQIGFVFGKVKFSVRHASPWDETTYIYPDSYNHLKRIELSDNEVLVLAHTHHPMLIKVGDGFVLNPGSVGQPRDGTPEASYAILDTLTGAISLRRAPYDTAAYAQELRNADIHPRLIRYFEPEKL